MKDDKKFWKKNLNLIFVYIIIFVCGLVTVFLMTNILNNSVQQITNSISFNVSK